MTARGHTKELIKLALHHFLQPTILGNGPVSYELWSPSGLTEPAATFFDTWPRGWDAELLGEDAIEVIESFKAFENLRWDDIGTAVVSATAQLLKPVVVDGIQISVRVRADLAIYDSFFQGKLVMSREHVVETMRVGNDRIIDELRDLKEKFVQLTDADAAHVVSRIASFPAHVRVAHLSGYVMGLPVELIGRMNEAELERFLKQSVSSTFDLIKTVTDACTRLAFDHAASFRESNKPIRNALPPVLLQVITATMIHRVTGMLFQTRRLQPDLEAFAVLPLRAQFEHQARRLWGSYQRCIAGYDSKRHPPGSDGELRLRIALTGMEGAKSETEFVVEVLVGFDRLADVLARSVEEYMSLVPKEILVFTDTVTAFDHPGLRARASETFKALELLRADVV